MSNIVENPEKEEVRNPDAAHQMMDWSGQKYRSFQDYVAVREDDAGWMVAYKLFLRITGIAIMIILSPFLLIGLTIAFVAVF